MPKQIFPEEGVEVNVPEHAKKKLKIVKLGLGKTKDYPVKPGGFRPKRLLINFAIIDEADPDTFVEEFDPPIEVTVKCKKKDLEDAENDRRPLQLAFWNGSDWIVLTEEKHGFSLYRDPDANKGGYATLRLSRWGDPPLAWG